MGLIMIASISAVIAPGFALLSYFYLEDEYEKEPILNVFRAFLLAVSLVFPIMFIQYVIDVEGILPSSFLQAFFSASLLEEFFKWFILYFTIYQSEERRVGKEYRSRCGLYDVNENSSTE